MKQMTEQILQIYKIKINLKMTDQTESMINTLELLQSKRNMTKMARTYTMHEKWQNHSASYVEKDQEDKVSEWVSEWVVS